MNFRNQQFFRVRRSPFGVVYILCVETPKGTHSEFILSVGIMSGLQENFPMAVLRAGHRKFRRFGLRPCPLDLDLDV